MAGRALFVPLIGMLLEAPPAAALPSSPVEVAASAVHDPHRHQRNFHEATDSNTLDDFLGGGGRSTNSVGLHRDRRPAAPIVRTYMD